MSKLKIRIEPDQNPIGKIIDAFVSHGTSEKGSAPVKDYVVSRKDCFMVCELVLRHFILNYGHDDLLPGVGGINQLIENYTGGKMNFFEESDQLTIEI